MVHVATQLEFRTMPVLRALLVTIAMVQKKPFHVQEALTEVKLVALLVMAANNVETVFTVTLVHHSHSTMFFCLF
jgi:hypothetical protein